MSSLKAMFSFFTMIRMDITQKDMDDMDRQFFLVPVIGLFYGIVAALLLYGLAEIIPILPAAVLTMIFIQCMNRFLHIDGLMDVGDGLAVAGEREDHLRALKDTRIGAGGMAAAMLVTVLAIMSMASVQTGFIIFTIFSAEVLAKNSMVSAAAFGTPGNGMAGNSVRLTNKRSLIISTVLSALFIAVCVILTVWADVLGTDIGNARLWSSVIVLILISVISGLIMSMVAKKNFGMVNGDVLGATNEISRCVTLLMILALIPVI